MVDPKNKSPIGNLSYLVAEFNHNLRNSSEYTIDIRVLEIMKPYSLQYCQNCDLNSLSSISTKNSCKSGWKNL